MKQNKKEDNEIISYVKQQYEKNMTEQVNAAIDLQGKTVGEMGIIISDTTTLFSPYTNIKPAPYKLSIISDSTGNNTDREVFAYQEYAPINIYSDYCMATITYAKLAYIPQYEGEKGATNCFQVYDSWYGGYTVEKLATNVAGLATNNTTKEYLLTRVDSSKHFTLDEVGTSNIGIDNADSLFEKIRVVLELDRF